MNKFGFYGNFKVQKGKRDELVAILLEAAQLMRNAKGCHQYLISRHTGDEDRVVVTEIWDSKQDHDLSLNLPGCKELIMTALPLMDGKPEVTELEIMGGKSTIL